MYDPISRVVSPKLTTTHFPGYQVGETAAAQLISHPERLSDMRTTPEITLRADLVIRNSTVKKKYL